MPFGAGRHICVASNAGWIEALIGFASILKHFYLTTDMPVPVQPRMEITIQPARELPITLCWTKRRNQPSISGNEISC
jgi:cytochrome P450